MGRLTSIPSTPFSPSKFLSASLNALTAFSPPRMSAPARTSSSTRPSGCVWKTIGGSAATAVDVARARGATARRPIRMGTLRTGGDMGQPAYGRRWAIANGRGEARKPRGRVEPPRVTYGPARPERTATPGTTMHDRAANFFRQLQDQICAALEKADGGAKFREDTWQRPGGGG